MVRKKEARLGAIEDHLADEYKRGSGGLRNLAERRRLVAGARREGASQEEIARAIRNGTAAVTIASEIDLTKKGEDGKKRREKLLVGYDRDVDVDGAVAKAYAMPRVDFEPAEARRRRGRQEAARRFSNAALKRGKVE